MSARIRTTTVTNPAVKLALTVVPYLLVAVLLYVSIPKFLGTDATVAAYTNIGAEPWLRYTTATFELLGAIGLLIPRLVGLAAIGLTTLLTGAVLTQAFVVPDGSVVMPAVLLLVCATIAWLRRDRVADLFTRS